jgi:hypothetical protein
LRSDFFFGQSAVANSNNVATLSDGGHSANMALLGDAGQHFSHEIKLVGVADVHHHGHLV